MSKSLLIIIIGLILSGLIGCASKPTHVRMTQVHENMDKSEVLELVGSPSRTQRRQGRDEWTFIYPIDRKLYGTKVTFEQGYVVSKNSVSLRPSKTQQIMDSGSFKAYEKEILDRRSRSKNNFIDLD